MSIQVTLIGGPADLQRHVMSEYTPYLYVAELCPILLAQEPIGECHALAVPAYKHAYEVRRIDRDVYVGVHVGLRR